MMTLRAGFVADFIDSEQESILIYKQPLNISRT